MRSGLPLSPVTEADGDRARESLALISVGQRKKNTSAGNWRYLLSAIQNICICDVWQWDLVVSVSGLRGEMQGGEGLGGGMAVVFIQSPKSVFSQNHGKHLSL